MKVLILALLLAVALANTYKDDWIKVHRECQSDQVTHVPEEIFEKLRKKEKVDFPDNFSLHAFCMLKKLDIQDDQGNPEKATIKKAVQRTISDSAKVEEIVNHCSVAKETKEKTALAIFKCFGKNNIDIGQL
ncbi:uncharacterized protein LOC115889057 [Sitophilus oryzae]|uniref:Uncharacterized protein LOC115889057 n=1 Tax=Sitophilus oryzae TaxID=7048 RepID=A0A6J2YNL0_SITOR|nr:uncharacterized protein LOC115889057 [Sitophilus oryzae]